MKKIIFGFGFITISIILLAFSSSTYSQDIKKQIQQTEFKYKWEEGACGRDNCTISSFIPPFPLSMFYTERSVINVNIISRGPKIPTDLKAIMLSEKREIKELNKNIIREPAGRYTKPAITSWIKNISDKQIGFLKYKVPHPEKSDNPPVTITQVVVMGNKTLYFIHLITFFKAQQTEAHNDMLRIVENLVKPKK